MATTVRSRKAKGFGFQKKVAQKIREVFGLDERAVVSAPSSVQGVDIILSDEAKKKFPYSIECKNTEKLSVWKAIEQSQSNIAEDTAPAVIFKRNRSETFVILSFEEFLDLARSKHELSEMQK